MRLNVDDLLETIWTFSQNAQTLRMIQQFVVVEAAPLGDDGSQFSQALYDYFADNILPDLTSALALVSVLTNNLSDGLTFSLAEGAEIGGNPSPQEPVFSAVGYRLTRNTKIVREGSKRVPGLCNEHVSGNALVTAQWPDAALKALFADARNITIGLDTCTISPVIIGRNPPPVYGYDLTRVAPVQSAVTAPRITTQNSRKVGRGE